MYHLHIRRVSKSNKKLAKECFEYIARIGRFANRGDIVRTVHSRNLPNWVDPKSGAHFWGQVDSIHMRSNGRLLFFIDVALPRDLPTERQNALASAFAESVGQVSAGHGTKGRLTTSYAIHEGVRADDAKNGRLANPHVHLLISPSIVDGHDRPRELWFRRANSKKAAMSGSPRSTYIGTKRWLLEVRRLWADMANAALKSAGLSQRVDHRSHADRGLLTKPTIHVGAKASHLARMGMLTRRITRNARIQELNETLNELQAQHTRRKRQIARRRQELQSQEDALRQSLSITTRQLEVELAGHPLMAQMRDLLAAACILVVPKHWPMALHGSDALVLADLAEKILSSLGQKWLMVRVDERYFFLRPPQSCVCVLGPGFIATDATDKKSIAEFAEMLKQMGFANPVVSVRPEVRDVVELALQEAGVEVDDLNPRHKSKLTGGRRRA